MYNYIYNSAVNWFYSETENQITEGAPRDITTEKDHLSFLPPEILTEIMIYLSLESVQALSLTSRKISITTKPVIQFKTNLKIQKLLESFNNNDSNPNAYWLLFNHGNQEIFKEHIEKAKTFQDGSNEKIEALRDAICSIFHSQISLSTLLSCDKKEIICKDKFLMERLMKDLKHNADHCYFPYNTPQEIEREILFLNLLKANDASPKSLGIEFSNVPVPEKLIEALVEALHENQSINSVSICWKDCDLIQLEAILEAVSNNERIVKFHICDTGSKRCFGSSNYWWERCAKEKNFRELEDLIRNKLKFISFKISQIDGYYGSFSCERRPL